MKKTILFSLICIFFAYNNVNAKGDGPKNVVKMNVPSLILIPLSPIGGNLPLTYERAFGKFSGSLHLKFGIPRDLGKSSIIDKLAGTGDYGDTAYGNPFKGVNYAGFSIMPEFKFYTSGEKDAPEGFYVSLYFKYTNYRLKSSYQDVFTDNIGGSFLSTVTMVGRYKPIGGGIAIGYQWLINDHFSIDWTFIGLGWGTNHVSLEFKTDDPRVTQTSITDNVDDVTVNFAYGGKAKLESTNNSVKATFSFPWPMMRFFGFNMGYAF